MDGSSKGQGAARGIAILVIGFLAAGAFVVSPATAGRFLTKKAGDRRYINVGEKASDSDKLDGLDSSTFLSSTAKAADADKLDGTDGAAYLDGPIAYASIRGESATPTVIDSGGTGVTSVTVDRVDPGTWNVTFNGSFPGATADNITPLVTIRDTDGLNVAALSMDESAVGASQIRLKVWVWRTTDGAPEDRDFSVAVLR